MGMPEQKPQSGMNIAPDGTIYEILEDGSIKRIGKVSSNGEFEPFGGLKDGVRVKEGIIYRVINGKEQKIGRVLPNGDIESISQKIKREAEISRSKSKILTIACSLAAFLVLIYVAQQVWFRPHGKISGTEEARGNLQWSDKALEKMFARDAIFYCENLSENGHNDWRLPDIDELRTLIENCPETETGGACGITGRCLSQSNCKNQACNGCEIKAARYSRLGDEDLFWSSSFRPESSNNAWYVDFNYASIHGHSDKKKSVRCVR